MLVNKEFIKNIESYERLAHGTEGTVYYDGAYLYKLYKVFDQERFPINRSLITGFESDFIAFPIEEYKLSDRITIGYKMPYYEAYNVFWNGFKDNTLISDLEKAYLDLILEVKKYNNFEMFDVESNILFDGKKFYLIDTDRWCFSKDDFNFINYKFITLGIKKGILRRLDIFNSFDFEDDLEFLELYRFLNFSFEARELLPILKALKEFYQLKVGEELKTIGDLNGGKICTLIRK